MKASTRSRSITRTGAGCAPRGREASRAAAPTRAAAGPDAASGGPSTPRAPPRPSGGPKGPAPASPGWRRAPVLQDADGPLQLCRCEPVGARVLDERHTPAGRRAVSRRKHVGNGKRVADDERAALVARQHKREAAHVALDDGHPALAAARGFVTRCRRAGPRAIVSERATLEAPVARVVQLRDDDLRHVAPSERDVGGLARALELTRHAQVDRVADDAAAELLRLLLSLARKRPRYGDIAVHEQALAEDALAVSREDQRLHSTCSRATSSTDLHPSRRSPSSTSSRSNCRMCRTPSSPRAASA